MDDTHILSQHRFGMVTYSPQISYPSLTNDFLNIFLIKLKELSPHFVWGIEKDGQPGVHFHCVFSVTKAFEDVKEITSQKVKTKFLLYKEMKNFLNHARVKCSCGPHQLQAVLLTNDHLHHMTKIGYCLKENPLRKEITFSLQTITEAIRFYWSSIKTQITVTDDWDLLTPQNAYIKLPHICKDQNIDLTGDELLYFLSINGVGYVNISTKQLKTVCLQLKTKQEFKGEKNPLKLHQLKLKLNEHAEYESEKLNPADVQNPWISKYMTIFKQYRALVEDYNELLKEHSKNPKFKSKNPQFIELPTD